MRNMYECSNEENNCTFMHMHCISASFLPHTACMHIIDFITQDEFSTHTELCEVSLNLSHSHFDTPSNDFPLVLLRFLPNNPIDSTTYRNTLARFVCLHALDLA